MRLSVIALGTLWLAIGCSSDSHGPPDAPQQDILALGGCYDPTDPQCSHTPPTGDPSPAAPGVYLGSDFSPTNCTREFKDDVDLDGFDDFCEFQLALAFRPLLATDPLDDDLTRQPYWAVEWSGITLKIAFLIGYYFDNGNSHATVCQGTPHLWCWGHFGDSEFIIVQARYDSGSQHWYVLDALTSAHYMLSGDCGAPLTHCDHTVLTNASSLEFPEKVLHYPRIYVALNKHGNYYSREACNGGGPYNSDDCTNAQDNARVQVNRHRSVGSSVAPQIMGTTSTVNPVVFYGTEYFFGAFGRPFCGWDGPSTINGRGNCATSYETILLNFGF